MTRVVAFILALGCAPPVLAHEIPSDVTVHAFVKPKGTSLVLLVRVPLKAMRDVNFPLRGPGFLDLSRADPFLRDAALLWIADGIEIEEQGTRLAPPRLTAARVSLPSDQSFRSYADALRHVSGVPLTPETDIAWDHAMLDAMFEYAIASDDSRFSIRTSFARLGLHVVTVVRFLASAGGVRAFEFTGDPGLVRLDPRWHQAALRFVRLGFEHILTGADHLLFLFCLVVPIRRLKPLVIVITAFTAAHSITLITAALNAGPDGLWFPPFIETLIAASIVYMSLENIVVAATPTEAKPLLRSATWAVAFVFGLVHGFGFSFALRESLQFAGSHLLTSLLSFNVGVELGQLVVLAIMVPVLFVLFRFVVPERVGTIVLSALVAHVAWHWTGERWSRLRQFGWPTIDAPTLVMLVRGVIVLVAIAAATWMVVTIGSRRRALSERKRARVGGRAPSERERARVEGPVPSEREHARVEGA